MAGGARVGPGVGVLDLLTRRGVRHLETVSLLWDLSLFMTVEVMLDAPDAAAAGYLLVAAFHAYVGGPSRAWLTGGLMLTAMVAAPLLNDGEISGHLLVAEALAGVLLVSMLAVAADRQDAAERVWSRSPARPTPSWRSIASEVIHLADRAGARMEPGRRPHLRRHEDASRGSPLRRGAGLAPRHPRAAVRRRV